MEVREHPRRKDSARGSSLAPADTLPLRSCRASPSPATARHQRHGRGDGKADMLAGIEPPPEHLANGAALRPLAVRPLGMDPAPSPQRHLQQRRTRRASGSARHILRRSSCTATGTHCGAICRIPLHGATGRRVGGRARPPVGRVRRRLAHSGRRAWRPRRCRRRARANTRTGARGTRARRWRKTRADAGRPRTRRASPRRRRGGPAQIEYRCQTTDD